MSSVAFAANAMPAAVIGTSKSAREIIMDSGIKLGLLSPRQTAPGKLEMVMNEITDMIEAAPGPREIPYTRAKRIT